MSKQKERSVESMHLKEDIKNTQENIANTEAVIAQTDDEKLREELKERNIRREEAVNSFQMGIEDRIAYKNPKL